jgi:putative FmdB family regulatory protein
MGAFLSADYECESCKEIHNVFVPNKGQTLEQEKECPSCGGKSIKLISVPTIDVAAGKCGNAKTKYESQGTYAPSRFKN